MNLLLTEPSYADRLAALRLTSCESIVRLLSEGKVPAENTVFVQPKTLRLPDHSTLSVFYKQYEYGRPAWQFLGRRSKARCEYDNYGVFTQLGIPCPARIACGEERDALGRLRRAFIITEAIPEARPLSDYFPAQPGDRAALIRQLAAMVRRIHDANFFHHDLVWRNILVTGEAKLWWIDCPRGGFSRQRRRQLKDLASLDKLASQHCTRTERLRFVKLYLDKKRLDAETKQLVRATLAYRKRRWPDDWA